MTKQDSLTFKTYFCKKKNIAVMHFYGIQFQCIFMDFNFNKKIQ